MRLTMQDSNDYLPGYLIYDGAKQEAPQFDQGVDITLDVPLTIGNNLVKYDDYTIIAILKADTDIENVTWKGCDKYGVSKNRDNSAKVLIPKSVAINLLSGIYHLAVIGIDKNISNHTVVLWKGAISLNLSAASTMPTYPTIVYLEDDTWLDNLGIYVPIDYFSI